MSKVLYFQPFSGASGDMILGALIDSGLSLDDLREGLQAIELSGYRLEAKKEKRGPFEATRFKVLVDGAEKQSQAHRHVHRDPEHHGKDHNPKSQHAHGHGPHSHDHLTDHSTRPQESKGHHGHVPHRSLSDILRLIDQSALPSRVKESATLVFCRIGKAESKVHGVPIETVYFHEVGAVDSIVDIVGSCLGLHLLGIEEVHSSPITVGTGLLEIAHGMVPLPAPATLELLRGYPLEQRESGVELTTPTGAALLTTLSKSFGTMPPLVVSAVGYGAGDDRPGPIPNALRAILGDRKASGPIFDRVVVLETNIDDMSPEWMGHLLDRLFEAGAVDVSLTPALMKKSRPAQEVKVLVPLSAEARVVETLFGESTTFGIRRTEADRVLLTREFLPVATPWGMVKVKVGRLGGKVMTAAPEYEDLRAAALKAGLSLKEVHEKVMESYRARGG